MTRILLLLLVVLGLALGAPAQNTYYFDKTSGNDASDGLSPATAKQNISWINTNQQTGDTYLLKAGETFTTQLTVTVDGMTVASYGKANSGRATFNPAGSPGSTAILLSGVSNFSISHIEIDDANNGIFVDGSGDSSGFLGYNLYIHDCAANGFNTSSTAGFKGDNNALIACIIQDNGGDGVGTRAQYNLYVEGCTLSGHNASLGSSDGASAHDDGGMYLRSCLIYGNADGVHHVNNSGVCVIDSCYIYDNEADAIAFYPTSGAAGQGSLAVINCIVVNEGSAGAQFDSCLKLNNGVSVAVYNSLFDNRKATNGSNRFYNIYAATADVQLIATNNIFLLNGSTSHGHHMVIDSTVSNTSFTFRNNVWEDRTSEGVTTSFRDGSGAIISYADFVTAIGGVASVWTGSFFVEDEDIPLTDPNGVDVSALNATPVEASGTDVDLIRGGIVRQLNPARDYFGRERIKLRENFLDSWTIGPISPDARPLQKEVPSLYFGPPPAGPGAITSGTYSRSFGLGNGPTYINFSMWSETPEDNDYRANDRGARWVTITSGSTGTALLTAVTGTDFPINPFAGGPVSGAVALAFPGTYTIQCSTIPITAIQLMSAAGGTIPDVAVTSYSFAE